MMFPKVILHYFSLASQLVDTSPVFTAQTIGLATELVSLTKQNHELRIPAELPASFGPVTISLPNATFCFLTRTLSLAQPSTQFAIGNLLKNLIFLIDFEYAEASLSTIFTHSIAFPSLLLASTENGALAPALVPRTLNLPPWPSITSTRPFLRGNPLTDSFSTDQMPYGVEFGALDAGLMQMSMCVGAVSLLGQSDDREVVELAFDVANELVERFPKLKNSADVLLAAFRFQLEKI